MAKLLKEDIELNIKIAKRIKILRMDISSKPSQFAKEHMIDRQVLHRWESTTDNRGISIHTIYKFTKLIGISLKDFFDDPLFK